MRLDLLTDALRRRAIGDAKIPEGQQRRLDRFVVEFFAHWRAQTVCSPRFLALDQLCGNAPALEERGYPRRP